jgi:type I restriction enzyme S subunit
MNKYQSYKPSGVEWIGEIPEHWVTKKMKYLVQICNGSEFKDFTLEEGGYPVYGSGGEFSRSSKFIYDKISVLLGRKGSIDKPKIVNEPFWCSDTTYYTIIFDNVNPIFFFYLVQQINFERYVYGSTIPSMTKSVYDEMVFPYPSSIEQLQIVQFLDEKTELIDRLISTKERKITLLKEERTSLINQVVTKGLNPNVKMKDSGVEWFGEIPENWIKSKVKYVSTIFGRIGYRGYTVEDIVDEGEGVITISPSNIKNDIFTIEGENTFLSFEKYEESPEIQIFTDDIILVKTGSTIGKTSLIPSGVPKMTINPQLVVLKEIKIDNKYFYYQTVCEFFKKSFLVEQTGSSTPTISQEKINGFPILIPSTEEQLQIVEHLDSKTKEIDDLVHLEQKKIDLLKQYRQSLISEVVTGKVKTF